MYRRQLAFIVCLVLATIPTEAQVVTATLNGNVTDSSGGAIPGATVTATQREQVLSEPRPRMAKVITICLT